MNRFQQIFMSDSKNNNPSQSQTRQSDIGNTRGKPSSGTIPNFPKNPPKP